ncbi:MAG: hypothetical protein IKW54_05590 [Bacteroidales bacterium]|nr:hypothetical protein [Bacteroidales bacterium]
MNITIKRFFTFFSLLFLIGNTNLIAEEFVAKHGSYEKNGQKIKITDLSNFPSFNAEYQQSKDVVTIKSSAGNLVLNKGNFFYSCKGVRNGVMITATAYVQDGKLEHIVYEEYDSTNNIKATISYYRK